MEKLRESEADAVNFRLKRLFRSICQKLADTDRNVQNSRYFGQYKIRGFLVPANMPEWQIPIGMVR